jgi:hypothetical protein
VFSTPLASRKSPQWLLLVLLLLSTLFTAQPRSLVHAANSAAELPQGLNLKDIKFTPDPDDITGACQMAVLRGDLAKGPSAIAYKSERTPCVVPMHWHSSAEWLVIIYGVGNVENKGHKPLRLTKGGFFFQPAHQIGGGTFEPNTLVFISFDGPADTHWVDDKGTEITGLEAFRRIGLSPKKK